MSSSPQASSFMGKEYSENLRSIKNTGNNLTMKHMLDTSEKLIVGHTIDGEPMEFEWSISHVSQHCSSATKSKSSYRK